MQQTIIFEPSFTSLQLNKAWEILFLEEKDVLFVHSYRNHFRLRKTPQSVRVFLRQLDKTGVIPHKIHTETSTSQDKIERYIRNLVAQLKKESVLITKPIPDSDSGLRDSEVERFRSLIDFLAEQNFTEKAIDIFKKIRSAHVVIIGLGGAGTVCATMLAASGVGHLTLVDGDVVQSSNLVRQIFYSQSDADQRISKAKALSKYILNFSRFTMVTPIEQYISYAHECIPIIEGANVVVLTADAPRIILNREINKACVEKEIPLIYSFLGQIGPFYIPDISACFVCLEGIWRNESGTEHDEIVEALQVRPTREYPSLVSGPVQIGQSLFDEVFAYLCGVKALRTLNKVVKLDTTNEKSVTVLRNKRCPICSKRVYKRP